MTTDTVGGVWQYSLALVRGLVEQFGCQVLLFCFGNPTEQDLKDAQLSNKIEIESRTLKLEWMSDSANDVRKGLDYIGLLAERWMPDLVHGNQFCMGLLASSVPKLVVAHSDVLSWMAWHLGQPRGTLSGVALDLHLKDYRDLVAAGLKCASILAAPSRFMADSLLQIYGCRSTVIYNGVWADQYPLHNSKEDTAIVAGRLWDKAKGATLAIEATAGLPITLKLAGSTVGPCGETIDLPPASHTAYLGALSWRDLREALSRSKLYIAASSYEPFGLAALEAAFCGCALVASNIPSYREIWGDSAVYFAAGSRVDLRSRIGRLLESPGEIEKLAAAARARAVERYTAAEMSRRYFDLYRTMIGRDSRTSHFHYFQSSCTSKLEKSGAEI